MIWRPLGCGKGLKSSRVNGFMIQSATIEPRSFEAVVSVGESNFETFFGGVLYPLSKESLLVFVRSRTKLAGASGGGVVPTIFFRASWRMKRRGKQIARD